MSYYSKLPYLFLSGIIASILAPQVALGQNSRCSNFWVNPNTGQQECLNDTPPPGNSNQTDFNRTDNNRTVQPNSPSLELEKASDIQDAVKLSDKLMQVVLKISNCKESRNESLESCKCQTKSDIDSIKRLFQSTIEKHPSWKNRTIKYPLQNSSMMSSPNITSGTGKINFPKLKKELESGKYLGQPCK